MMLIDDGKLALADPVSKYIPTFANMQVGLEMTDAQGEANAEARPGRAASDHHGSAAAYFGHQLRLYRRRVGDEGLFASANMFDGKFNNKEFAERIAKLPLARQPGTLWRYGHSTDVLGRVIEIVSGETLYDFLKQRILDPLGHEPHQIRAAHARGTRADG